MHSSTVHEGYISFGQESHCSSSYFVPVMHLFAVSIVAANLKHMCTNKMVG